MVLLAKIKAQLQEFKNQSRSIKNGLVSMDRLCKIGLWGGLLAIILLPARGIGVVLILADRFATLTNKQE